MKTATAPLICSHCKTNHADRAKRDASCPVLAAEIRISDLYHNGGSAREIRLAQADRADALGNAEKAARLRAEAQVMA